ncbi:DNase I-like protein [Aspergillus steynii IBT 23096]|uniref:phosphoinositide 5-phosphatase n=1 Tax=Aspergillus steynii IBT 23096 TaxID=1392250 RepID=A0A2I2GN48_9EURO|nr:DNase I-like protein [Aspergillus steynii IBT 23096]PLB54305.1 DNase I-like protein [Aspergillus steynii IBT 23096]
MSSLRILARNHPQRTLALATTDYVLIFKHSSTISKPSSQRRTDSPRCLVEFASQSDVDLSSYQKLGDGYGTLGLITFDDEVFLSVVTARSKAATIRPGENISRIDNVDFFCLNHSEYEDGFDHELRSSSPATEDFTHNVGLDSKELVAEHPFLALKKLLGDGSFYYSLDFNLTDRLQDRSDKSATFDIESLDEDMLWNSYMIHPLLLFRSHLSSREKQHLDSCQILTCVIRGFSSTLTIPASVSILPRLQTHYPSTLSIISRQSSRRAGTRFNSRGIDDDGHVANYVETETILWMPPGITFSYVQVRGSVPIFWEQASAFLPGQQKIDVTRSSEATQHAFDKHFEGLELEYGAIHVVNLLSELKPAESELSAKFREHIKRSPLNQKTGLDSISDHTLLRATEFDFHAETRGPLGYAASGLVKHEISHSMDGFAFFLSENNSVMKFSDDGQTTLMGSSTVLQQEGVFRTNCLDCLDRTNHVQNIISSMALESFFLQQGATLGSDVQLRHSTLWADNGDALSKIYAGTGALKSSFTRHGRMSLAGALADARKTATRLYVNNFSDKARQKTIDLLLGRLTGQVAVHLHDPINDLVLTELNRRASEYSFTKSIKIWTGTFNVNGRHLGTDVDLTPWLLPELETNDPMIFAVGFQEIVALSPQQIMSTDPSTRKTWEAAVGNCLNSSARSRGTTKYVLLRSGQLVGAALMVFVREDVLKEIKNVEGSVKKTGLSGIAGNKGGCAIRLEYSNTRICFVTAHLAAGFANYDERNRDYETICHGLRFQRNRSIDDHDSIIWLGDFNYRIGLGNHNVRELVLQRDYQKLYDNDQLNLQMVTGRAFQFYTEGSISFPPTYKYDVGRDEYDTSEKARIPAWCDRVLWRGTNLHQVNYKAADLRFSDHRPVWATFLCEISTVDETAKSELRRSLYYQKRSNSGDLVACSGETFGLSDEELTRFDPIMPGLPPASSDHQKWWLDHGAPVKSTVKPPDVEYTLSSYRRSNPFSSSSNSNWVLDHKKSGSAASRPQPSSRMTVSSTTNQSRSNSDTWCGSHPDGSEYEDTTTVHGSLSPNTRAAPPIPRKPVLLTTALRKQQGGTGSLFCRSDPSRQ